MCSVVSFDWMQKLLIECILCEEITNFTKKCLHSESPIYRGRRSKGKYTVYRGKRYTGVDRGRGMHGISRVTVYRVEGVRGNARYIEGHGIPG